MELKFHDLDVKVTEIQSVVEQLQDDKQERQGKTTTNVFARVPRAQRSVAVPVTHKSHIICTSYSSYSSRATSSSTNSSSSLYINSSHRPRSHLYTTN